MTKRLRHDAFELLVSLRRLGVGLQDRLTDQVGRQARAHVREIRPDRAAFPADLMAGSAAGAANHRHRISVAAGDPGSSTTTGRRTAYRRGGSWDGRCR